MKSTLQIMQDAKAVKSEIALLSTAKKANALHHIAKAIIENSDRILLENAKDIENAKGKISDVMIDRLTLTKERIESMSRDICKVASLPDPVGKITKSYNHENGLIINRTSCPIGVIAIIYESRPNVTSDAASLALMSGNACILRVGKEAYMSAKAICDAIQSGLDKSGVNVNAVQLIEDTTRASATELMEGVGYIDLLIPRGGKGLISACVEKAKVPCIQTGTGICHIYVDESANLDMARDIIINAKTSRPSVCNAEEVLLVNSGIAKEFLPMIKKALVDDRISNGNVPVELRLDEKSSAVIDGTKATETDFDTEFLDYILAIKIVDNVKEAISHISEHSTGHSESIITENKENAMLFTKMTDSAAVYVNASTRFTDGGEFGLGCEMGISTQKLHARGPMGLEELTTYKYIITGKGQIR